jgi:hypothetical protein
LREGLHEVRALILAPFIRVYLVQFQHFIERVEVLSRGGEGLRIGLVFLALLLVALALVGLKLRVVESVGVDGLDLAVLGDVE